MQRNYKIFVDNSVLCYIFATPLIPFSLSLPIIGLFEFNHTQFIFNRRVINRTIYCLIFLKNFQLFYSLIFLRDV